MSVAMGTGTGTGTGRGRKRRGRCWDLLEHGAAGPGSRAPGRGQAGPRRRAGPVAGRVRAPAGPGRAGGGAGRGGAAPVSLSFPGGGVGAGRRWRGRGAVLGSGDAGASGGAGTGRARARRGEEGAGRGPAGRAEPLPGLRAPPPPRAGMAGRTVRVRGFPADLPPDRAADKLTIHFLRSRNGGGEIADVQVLPGPPACALITFEALEGNGGRAAPAPRPGPGRRPSAGCGADAGPVALPRSGPEDPGGQGPRAVDRREEIPAGGGGPRRGAEPRRGSERQPRSVRSGRGTSLSPLILIRLKADPPLFIFR